MNSHCPGIIQPDGGDAAATVPPTAMLTRNHWSTIFLLHLVQYTLIDTFRSAVCAPHAFPRKELRDGIMQGRTLSLDRARAAASGERPGAGAGWRPRMRMAKYHHATVLQSNASLPTTWVICLAGGVHVGLLQ